MPRARQVALSEFLPSAGELVCGLDEAGRGPLAGPVVASAVILPTGTLPASLDGLNDSKLLSPVKRERLLEAIYSEALAIGISAVPAEGIDSINILRASLLAMRRAALSLDVTPDIFLADGNHPPDLPGRVFALVGGDRRHPAISAASVVAKVTRDALMKAYHTQYPLYGFDKHKGYPTRRHLQALHRHGPCPIHRKSFRPVRQLVEA